MGGFLTLVEPVVVVHEVGNSFFEMALMLAVYNRSLAMAGGHSDRAQAISSRCYLIHSSLASLLSMLSIVALGRVADRHGPRVPLIASQLGSVLGMSVLLFFLCFQLPLEFLYLGAAVHGLSGGSPGFWGAVVSLAALSSRQGQRTLKFNTVDFCSGVAGVVGGLLSGYVYQLGQSGVALVLTSMLLHGAGLLYSTFLLSYPEERSFAEGRHLLPGSGDGARTDRAAVAVLFSAMVLFAVGMIGAEGVLSLYVLKPPLSWNSVWAGYGQAATNAMYLSSFLGVLLLSRPLGDKALILLGIVSNCTGMAVMAFATQSWVYFMARGIMLFACIPMPTIRAQLSKILDAKQYGETITAGRVFGWLQLALAVSEVLSTVFFTSIYPLTLGWYSGLCFLISSAISYISVIPILYLDCRGIRHEYVAISGIDKLQNSINTEKALDEHSTPNSVN